MIFRLLLHLMYKNVNILCPLSLLDRNASPSFRVIVNIDDLIRVLLLICQIYNNLPDNKIESISIEIAQQYQN